MQFKGRPALIIAKADQEDYVVIPISTVSNRANLDPDYDVEIDPAVYPLLGLDHVSYARTHKQLVIHSAEIGTLYGDMKSNYIDLYLDILQKREQFSQSITDQALE